jgi:dephospho-CoA kinase
MLKVALTGGIATGKSYVLDRFRKLGIPCLDADEFARGVTASGTEATREIANRFGQDILDSSGAVDRPKLAAIVFADDAARRDLEAIVHPAVYRAINAGVRAFELLGSPLVVVDIPLLYETGHAGDFARVIATNASPVIQLTRLVDRGMTEVEGRQRIAAQMPAAEKASRADFVINTNGTFEETDRQVDEVLRILKGPSSRSA